MCKRVSNTFGKTLLGIANGTLKPKCQCEEGLCYADKLTKEECKIDWSKPAQEIAQSCSRCL